MAMLIDAVSEVLAGHADAASLPALQLSLVNKIPFLHSQLASTSVLLRT